MGNFFVPMYIIYIRSRKTEYKMGNVNRQQVKRAAWPFSWIIPILK